MSGDRDFNRDKRAFGWVHNRSSYWYNNKENCENNLISQNNISTPDDDDVTELETQDGHPNRKNRNVRIHNMSNFQQFDMVWIDPLHGDIMTTTTETHGIGAFIIQLPDQVNWTTFHDLVFLMSPHNSSFYTPGLTSESSELYILMPDDSNSEEIYSDSTISKKNNFDIIVYPNPTSNKVMIECSEKVTIIEICNIMGEKIDFKQINNSYGEIDMTGFPKGVYIFKTITESKIFINRVVFQ